MPHMAVNGIKLNVEIEGAGEPVLLLHGLGSSMAALAAERALLRRTRQVIAVDCRGHGASGKPAHFTIGDHIADVLALMDTLAIERFALLGRSMGSYIAQGVACAAPPRVDALVLVAPRAHSTESGMTRLRRELAAELAGKSPHEQRRILLAAMLAPTTSERTVRLLAAASAASDEALTESEEAAATLATSVFDFRAGLTAVTARTLVLSGRHDRLNPPQAGALIAALIPEARHEVIENAGHLLAIEARASYLGLIRTFLAHPPIPQDRKIL